MFPWQDQSSRLLRSFRGNRECVKHLSVVFDIQHCPSLRSGDRGAYLCLCDPSVADEQGTKRTSYIYFVYADNWLSRLSKLIVTDSDTS
jgi:hypothetical protein